MALLSSVPIFYICYGNNNIENFNKSVKKLNDTEFNQNLNTVNADYNF